MRCKMQLTHVTETVWGVPGTKTLKFNAQYDDSIPEDRRFAKATPSAELTMQVNNPAAIALLTLGDSYYVDFSPVPK